MNFYIIILVNIALYYFSFDFIFAYIERSGLISYAAPKIVSVLYFLTINWIFTFGSQKETELSINNKLLYVFVN